MRFCGRMFLAVSVGLLVSRAATAADLEALDAARESIGVDSLGNHVKVLASDTFEGREAGSRGGRAAGVYLGKELQKLKIRGAGTDRGYYQEFGRDYRNVLGLLPGHDPEVKDEHIVIGAHYDHVGYGNSRNSRGPIGRIHNGADDNASGTSGLLELTKALAGLQTPLRRSIVIAFFDAEEKGVLGSKHWIRRPTLPLSQVRLFINLDMIGRMREQTVDVYGSRSARGLRRMVSRQNRDTQLLLDFNWEVRPDSDHYPFYAQRIPFLMLHTRKHEDYHRPSDDSDKLNIDGIQQATRLLFNLVSQAAESPELPSFRRAAYGENRELQKTLEAALPLPESRLGVSWDRELATQQVLQLTAVRPNSPAARAGLQVGDQILEFGGYRSDEIVDFRTVVLAAKSPVSLIVQRPGEEQPRTLTAQLAGKTVRVGIAWRDDDADPGCMILTRVTPGSPADLAGLRVTDRVYQISGHHFQTSEEFRQAVLAEESLELLVERQGRLQTLRVEQLAKPKPRTNESQ